MYASCALGTRRAADGSLDFIQYHIQGYDIWQNLAFWEEYFWDEVARKYVQARTHTLTHIRTLSNGADVFIDAAHVCMIIHTHTRALTRTCEFGLLGGILLG